MPKSGLPGHASPGERHADARSARARENDGRPSAAAGPVRGGRGARGDHFSRRPRRTPAWVPVLCVVALLVAVATGAFALVEDSTVALPWASGGADAAAGAGAAARRAARPRRGFEVGVEVEVEVEVVVVVGIHLHAFACICMRDGERDQNLAPPNSSRVSCLLRSAVQLMDHMAPNSSS